MSPEDQRIAIAEACGWKPLNAGIWTKGRLHAVYDGLPDYCNSLDACHEMENVLKNIPTARIDEQVRYSNELFEIISNAKGSVPFSFDMINATASQRCEAFLRAIGKWKPSTVSKCDSVCEGKDDVLPSKVPVAPSDKSDEERK